MLNNKEKIYSDDDITQIWGRRAMGTAGLLTNLQKSGPAAMRIDPGFTFCLQSGRLQSIAGSVLLTGVLLRKKGKIQNVHVNRTRSMSCSFLRNKKNIEGRKTDVLA